MSNNKEKEIKNIIGYVPLRNGLKEVTTLDNYFLTYTFNQKIYWETLRNMTNIFYSAYIEHYSDTSITPIKGKIAVRTEVTHYEKVETVVPKRQDLRIESKEKVDYVEFQRKPNPDPSIGKRSVQYFGFSLTSGADKRTSHLWLINGEVGELLHRNIFSNYILLDETDHHPHPNINNILYVNLERLAEANTQAGELARVLIGDLKTPTDPDVKLILKNLKNSFKGFRDDNKVRDSMTRREEIAAETRAELIPIITEQAEQIAEKNEQIAEKNEQIAKDKQLIAELQAQLAKQMK